MKKQIKNILTGILIAGTLMVTVQANTLPFVPFDPEKPVGDVNGNKVVNAEDSTLLNLYFAGYPVSIEEDLADVEGDGRVTRRDAMILSRYIAGWEGYTLPYTGNH